MIVSTKLLELCYTNLKWHEGKFGDIINFS